MLMVRAAQSDFEREVGESLLQLAMRDDDNCPDDGSESDLGTLPL